MPKYFPSLANAIERAENMRNQYRKQFEIDMEDAFPHLDRTWDEAAGMYANPKTQEFWFMFRCGAESEENRPEEP